jgi:hypothetical protein
MLKVIIFTIVFIAIVTIVIYIINPQAIDEAIKKVPEIEEAIKKVKTLVKKEVSTTPLNECEGTYEDWTDWTDWTNDSICPSATDYTIEDSAFNITQSRTRNRKFKISNSSSLLTDYSCPEEKDINIKQKETRIYTCPRNCSGVWRKFDECNAQCYWSGKMYDYILSNKGISTKIFQKSRTEGGVDTEVDANEKMQYIINKTALGKGVVCPEFDGILKEEKCNKLCEIDCIGGNWGGWYGCTAPACLDPYNSSAVGTTNGTQYRNWENAIGPFNGGRACPSQDSTPCSNTCKVHCQGEWTACDRVFGTDLQTYNRRKNPENGGDYCPAHNDKYWCNGQEYNGKMFIMNTTKPSSEWKVIITQAGDNYGGGSPWAGYPLVLYKNYRSDQDSQRYNILEDGTIRAKVNKDLCLSDNGQTHGGYVRPLWIYSREDKCIRFGTGGGGIVRSKGGNYHNYCLQPYNDDMSNNTPVVLKPCNNEADMQVIF